MKTIVLALATSISLIATAQQQKGEKLLTTYRTDTIRNLNVGDIVPDILIEKIVNDKQRSARISDYKDALLLLDFWTTGCSSCIAAFPKMDSLQHVFGNQIKILAVTYEAEDHVNTFFRTNKYGKETMLPSVVEDKVLNKWFKHWAIPHEVWIYKGKVVALTSSEYVTAKNIQYVLDGNLPAWPVKNDFERIDYSKPLLNNDQQNQMVSYSVITPYRENASNIGLFSTLDSVSNTRRNTLFNTSILQAYKLLWMPLVTIPLGSSNANRVILNVKDKSKYIYSPEVGYREEWNRKNQFCYESVTPDRGADIKEQHRLVISDLNRLFGTDARWEKRSMKCLILVRTSAKDKIKSKGGESISSIDKPIRQFRNAPLGNLVYTLNGYENNPPVFDETGYQKPVDISLNISRWTDIPSLRKALQVYDLDLKEEQREIDMFVLTENNWKK